MKKQRTVVITGGGTGMGKAAALKFANSGDRVYILGRRLERLEEVANENGNVIAVQADVTNANSVKEALTRIAEETPRVDVLVNCAGGRVDVDPNASLEEQLIKWDEVIKINLTSVFIVTSLFAEHISSPGGRIINVTSLAALGGSNQGGLVGQAYSAAKSGVHGLTRTLVKKYGPLGITVNSLAPGVIDNTDFFDGGNVPTRVADYYLEKTPMQRLGTPDDVAAGIIYLASDEASFITGEILNINGGVQFGR